MTTLGIIYMPNQNVRDNERFARISDKYGIDFLWIADETPAYPLRDSIVALSYIATITKRVRIGPGIFNPYSRNAIMAAYEQLTLHELSRERSVFGVGPGGSLPLVPLGIKIWDRPIRAVRETISVSRRIFNGETVDFDGQIVKARRVKPFTKFEKPIPIYLAARGPQMLGLAGELADGTLLASPIPYLSYAIDRVKEGLKKAGRSYAEMDLGCILPMAVSKDEEEARNLVRHSAALRTSDSPRFVIDMLGIDPRDQEEVRKALHSKGIPEAAKIVNDKMIDGFTVPGNVEMCIKKCQEFMRAGVKQLIFGDPFGAKPEDAFETICKEIVPHIRDN